MRLIAKVDTDQAEIVDALRKIGATVQHLHQVGKGCPDILVGYRGINWAFEIKRGGGATLTPAEKAWAASWRGQYAIVWNVTQAVTIVQGEYYAGMDDVGRNAYYRDVTNG